MIVDWLTSAETLRVLFGGILIALVFALALLDYQVMILPDRLNLALAVAGLCQAILIGRPGLIDAALGSFFAFALLWIVARIFRLYRGIDGLGFGDLKFVAAAGLWLGWEGIAPMLLIACCSALIFVLFRAWVQRGFDARQRLPFGPFLGLGTAVCWFVAVPQTLAGGSW